MEWLPFATFLLNLLLFPLLGVLWTIKMEVTTMKVQNNFFTIQIAELKSDLLDLRARVLNTANNTANAATAAATAIAEAATAAAKAAADAATAAAVVAAKLKE